METCFCLRCNAPFVPQDRSNPASPYYNYGCTLIKEYISKIKPFEYKMAPCNSGDIICPEVHDIYSIARWIINLDSNNTKYYCLECDKEYIPTSADNFSCSNIVDGRLCNSVYVINPTTYDYDMSELEKWIMRYCIRNASKVDVVCDESNNAEQDKLCGRLNVSVNIYPPKSPVRIEIIVK